MIPGAPPLGTQTGPRLSYTDMAEPSYKAQFDNSQLDTMLSDFLATTSLEEPGPVDLGLPFSFDDSLALDPGFELAKLGLDVDMDVAPAVGVGMPAAPQPERQPQLPAPTFGASFGHGADSTQREQFGSRPAGGLDSRGPAYLDLYSQPSHDAPMSSEAAAEEQFLHRFAAQNRPLSASTGPPSAEFMQSWQPGVDGVPPRLRSDPGMMMPPAGGNQWGGPRTGNWGGIAGKRGGMKKGSRLSRFGSYHGTGIEENSIDPISELGELNSGVARKARTKSIDPAGGKDKKRRPQSRSRKEKSGNCVCCDATNTPLWREGKNGARLCNACGIRWVKYGIACDTCKYVPRKSEASKVACPRCNTTFPPADAEAIRRRSTQGSSSGAASPSIQYQAPFGSFDKFELPGSMGRMFPMEGATFGQLNSMEQPPAAFPSHMAEGNPAPAAGQPHEQHLSPFGFYRPGTGLSRSVTR